MAIDSKVEATLPNNHVRLVAAMARLIKTNRAAAENAQDRLPFEVRDAILGAPVSSAQQARGLYTSR
jgi:hypothetical protein